MDEWMDGWVSGWMERWQEWMDGWVNEANNAMRRFSTEAISPCVEVDVVDGFGVAFERVLQLARLRIPHLHESRRSKGDDNDDDDDDEEKERPCLSRMNVVSTT